MFVCVPVCVCVCVCVCECMVTCVESRVPQVFRWELLALGTSWQVTAWSSHWIQPNP